MELAAAVVQALTEQFVQGVGKEAHYALDFTGHFGQMKQTLEVAEKFLNDKETNLKLKEGHVKAALIQLRKLIYEADDVVTDCLIRDEYKDDGLSGFFRRCDPVFLHQAGKKLKNINSRMQEQLQKLDAYSLSKQQSQPQTQDDHKSQNEERIMSSQDYNPNQIVGIDSNIKEIKEWIFERDKGLQCIAIAGMGGLGKTTIAQQIYNDSKVREHFQTIWVTVSKNFNKERISKYILRKLGGKVSEESDSSNLIKALEDARKMKDVNYLVVLDDVWKLDDMNWWNSFRSALTIQNKSCCIIVTTRDEGVASKVVFEKSRIQKPKTLDDENSWLLFSKFAFPLTEGECKNQQFKDKGMEILAKCGGLPLSIKTIGSLLASKNDELSTWTEVSESFHKSTVLEVNNDQVMASLRLSYDELEAHLKQCLLCLSVYPEDYEIRAEQIIHWWVAEGLVPRQGSNRTVLELGYQYLSALISRCLVEAADRRSYDGKVYTCKIHDMVRELIMQIAEEEAFCAFNERGIQEWKEDSYWLGFVDELIKEIKSFGKNSKLRAMLLVTSRSIDFDRNMGFPLSLRVLDLSGGCTNLAEIKRVNILLDWISSLKRLACLNLGEIKCLEELPSSVCKLQNLQMLILTGCTKLKKLHPSISKMKKLIVLHLGGCPLEYLPQGLGKLSSLQELTGFRVVNQTNSKACSLDELSNLTRLRELQMVISNDDFEIPESKLNEVLSKLESLKILDIDANECKKPTGLNMLGCLYPHKGLKELYLRNYHYKVMPKWIHPSTLPKLQYLCVEDGDITGFIPSEYAWKELEGLSLKLLGAFDGDWNEYTNEVTPVNEVMPVLRYMEVSPGYGKWTNPPRNLDQQSGIWRRKN